MVAADDPRSDHIPGGPFLTTEELRRDVSALREILQARLDGMDKANTVLSETVNRTPTAIQTAVANLRDVYDERFNSSRQQLVDRGRTFDERFTSIAQQFIERDVRTEQAATASASALAAALQAAKEAVFEQAQAAAKAAEKTETSFTKQIDQIQIQIKTSGDASNDRIAELKERIDRGEGSTTGAAGQRQETRLSNGQLIAVAALLLTILGLILLYATKK
jgi:anti-sigma28 factor (negative regulator of flagellin synthesis)